MKRRGQSRGQSRGQTMVLFALTLILLAMMVTMTLSIGAKAKEKMELQTLADAAAYSNAVATARTFNSVSLMNRALMGHMVAMTGVESLISWTSYYRGSINGLRNAYNNEPKTIYTLIQTPSCLCAPTNAACAKLCKCSTKALKDISKSDSDLKKKDNQLQNQFRQLDGKAGDEAKALQLSSISEAQVEVFKALTKNFKDAALAQKLVDEAKKGVGTPNELSAVKTSDKVNSREITGSGDCAGKGAACERREAGHKLHFVDAAMGSRGYAFVTARGSSFGQLILAKLMEINRNSNPDVVLNVSDTGSGYFPKDGGGPLHSGGREQMDATEVWGDDHGNIQMMFARGEAPCPPIAMGTSSMKAQVRSTHLADNSDEHTWTGGQDSAGDKKRHTMGRCTKCPGMWPSHMDYNFNLVTQEKDNWGQPKNYAVIQRDYAQRMNGKADPWNLLFRFRIGGKSETFDNKGIKLTTDGTDISKATALSTGIAYYKREGNFWQEPPNFLNPFWRATLVSAWVDQQGKDQDVGQVLGASGADFTKEAYEALKQSGYEGW